MTKKKSENNNIKCEIKDDWKSISRATNTVEEILKEQEEEGNLIEKESLNEFKKWNPNEEESKKDMEEKTAKCHRADKIGEKGIREKIYNCACDIEEMIYKMMIKTNKMYFESIDLSASLEQVNENKYKMTFTSPEKKIREKLFERLN